MSGIASSRDSRSLHNASWMFRHYECRVSNSNMTETFDEKRFQGQMCSRESKVQMFMIYLDHRTSVAGWAEDIETAVLYYQNIFSLRRK